jgi:bifunctional DNA-binding transcriptional regulator/antitoxin component of YhaV-PrlF toxin-antitoxin module
MELVEQVTVKVDSKGRICIPAELREEIGDTATLKRTQEASFCCPANAKTLLKSYEKSSILSIAEQASRRIGLPKK